MTIEKMIQEIKNRFKKAEKALEESEKHKQTLKTNQDCDPLGKFFEWIEDNEIKK